MSQQPDALRLAITNAHKHTTLIAKLENRKLANAFCAVTADLPHGRVGLEWEWTFNNVARGECAPKGQDLRDGLRDCLAAAVKTGNRQTIEATTLRVTAYLAEILTQVKAVLPESDAAPFTTAAVSAQRETAQALAQIAVAGTTRNETDLVLAVKEGDEAVASIEAFRASAMMTLHAPYRRSVEAK